MWGWQFANLKKEKPLRCGFDIGVSVQLKKVKVSSYIAQYPIIGIAQSALPFTSLAVTSIRYHHNLYGKHPALCCNQYAKAACIHKHHSIAR